MLEIKCPSCHGLGRVPKYKVNVPLICRKCRHHFYLTPTFQPILGEPPVPKDAPKTAGSEAEAAYEIGDALEALGDKFRKIRLPSPKVMGIAGGVVLLVGLVVWFFSRQSLETRAMIVAKAIASQDSDMMPIINVAKPGTENDILLWYAGVHQKYNDVKLMLGRDPAIRIQGTGSSKGGSAMVVATFGNPQSMPQSPGFAESLQPIPSLSNAKDSLEVPLFFVQEMGDWVLDGKRTAVGSPGPETASQ
jgi:hypothetical protein